jgi:hypothetical protein
MSWRSLTAALQRRSSPALGVLSAPVVPILVVSADAATALALSSGAPAVVRVIAATFLFGAAPGLGWTPVLRLDRDVPLAATTVLLISLAADVLVAEAVMTLDRLRWEPCAVALLILSAVGADLSLFRALRHPGRNRSSTA